MFPTPKDWPPVVNADLSALRPFHHYVGILDVRPAGYHFDVWYHDLGPHLVRVRVQRTEGRLDIVSEHGWWGSFGVPPDEVRPVRPDARKMADQVVAELQRRCPSSHSFRIRDHGRYRTVTAYELVAYDDRTTRLRLGVSTRAELAVDESLTTLIGVAEASGPGLGWLDAREGMQWTMLPPTEHPSALVGDVQQAAPRILEAARRQLANEPRPSLASLTPESDPIFPPGFGARVQAAVSFEPAVSPPWEDLAAKLEVRNAVFGAEATGEAALTFGSRVIRMHATLTPSARRVPAPGRTNAAYAGRLVVRVSDDHGGHWERTYDVAGDITLDGDKAFSPRGLSLQPAPSGDERRGELTRGRVGFVVKPTLSADPWHWR